MRLIQLSALFTLVETAGFSDRLYGSFKKVGYPWNAHLLNGKGEAGPLPRLGWGAQVDCSPRNVTATK
jgi:hypothetical protein